jgi:hypothetical protein
MDFPSLFIILFLIHSSINIGHLSCFSITFNTCESFIAFLVSSETLCYVNIVCFQSIHKSATLFLLCILHFFKSFFKIFPWNPLQICFWNEFFSHTINLFSSELNSYYLLLRQVFRHCLSLRQDFCYAEVFRCRLFLHQSFPFLFTVAPSFHCADFSATDLFVAQSFLLLPFPVHREKVTILIHCVERLLQSIDVHLKLTYINIMTTPQSKRKNARSEKVVRFEPQDLKLVNSYLTIRVSFEQAGCIRFYENFKGIMHKLTKWFTLNFTGVSATIAGSLFKCQRKPYQLRWRFLCREKNGLKVFH